MPQDLVVVATLGQRDLQGLVMLDGDLYKTSVKPVGAFHQALLHQELRYRFWLPESPDSGVKERDVAVWKEGQLQFEQGGRAFPQYRLATAADLGVAVDGKKPDLWLIPGLLWKYLLELKQELQQGRVTLRRFLLLYTDRGEAGTWAETEPRAAAPLLRDWLQGWLPGVSQGVIEAVAYLIGNEDMYVKDQTDSQFLRPAVATRIDEKLWEDGKFRGSQVRLHDSGGIPAVSDMLRSLARFRFGPDKIQYRPPVEPGRQPQPLEVLPGRPVTAVENLEARRRACDLVRRGEFQAAKVLADEFAESTNSPATRWGRCVAAVARYFQGYMTDARDWATQLTCTHTGAGLQALLADRWPQSLHVAMRAQAALIAQDFLSAASLTVTFLDVALLDAVDAALRLLDTPDKPCVDWASRQIDRSHFRPTESQLRHCAGTVRTTVAWLPSFNDADLGAWVRWSHLRAHQLWQEYTLSRAICDVGKCPDLAQALETLSEGLHKPTNRGNIPANFRNIIIHSLPSQEEIQRTVDLFASRFLWHREAGQPMSFLDSRARPAAVLTALGVGYAQQLHQQLIDGLVGDIEACPLT